MSSQTIDRQEWAEAFVAALSREAAKRDREGTASAPGRRTHLAGLRNVTLREDGAVVAVEADLYPPVQDRHAVDETRSVWTLTADNWASRSSGLARHAPDVAARLAFELLDRGPED